MRILTLAYIDLTLLVTAKEEGRGQITVPRIVRAFDYNNFHGRVLTRIDMQKPQNMKTECFFELLALMMADRCTILLLI